MCRSPSSQKSINSLRSNYLADEIFQRHYLGLESFLHVLELERESM